MKRNLTPFDYRTFEQGQPEMLAILKYFLDCEKIVNKRNESDMSVNYIKSLTTRWSAGIFDGYESKTYMNIKNAFRFYGAMEYNIFPWDISNRKIFTLRYKD